MELAEYFILMFPEDAHFSLQFVHLPLQLLLLYPVLLVLLFDLFD